MDLILGDKSARGKKQTSHLHQMPILKPDSVYRDSHLPLETTGKYFSLCCYSSFHNSEYVEGKVWSGTGHLYTNSIFVYPEHDT